MSNSSKASPVFPCCEGGKVRLPVTTTQQCPQEYLDLFDTADFLSHICAFNHMFTFTSLSADVDQNLLHRFPFTFKIQGGLYHRAANLLPSDASVPVRYAQVYFLCGATPDSRLEAHMEQASKLIAAHPNFCSIARTLQDVLYSVNPYVQYFVMASDLTLIMTTSDFRLQLLAVSRSCNSGCQRRCHKCSQRDNEYRRNGSSRQTRFNGPSSSPPQPITIRQHLPVSSTMD